MPLVPEDHSKGLVCERQLGAAWKRSALGKRPKSIARLVSKLIGEATTCSMLHGLPCALDAKSLLLVHGGHQLSEKRHEAEAAKRMSTDSFWVGVAGCDNLCAKCLYSSSELATKGRIRHVAQILQLSF